MPVAPYTTAPDTTAPDTTAPPSSTNCPQPDASGLPATFKELQPGWNLISVTDDSKNISDAILESSVVKYIYKYENGSYTILQDQDVLDDRLGTGYWVFLEDEACLSIDVGGENTDDLVVTVQPGWNLFSQPFEQDITQDNNITGDDENILFVDYDTDGKYKQKYSDETFKVGEAYWLLNKGEQAQQLTLSVQ